MKKQVGIENNVEDNNNIYKNELPSEFDSSVNKKNNVIEKINYNVEDNNNVDNDELPLDSGKSSDND